MEFIKHQNWRYATKQFNPNRKVSNDNIKLLKQAIQLSVSSYGLQPYKVLIIEDDTTKQQLRAASWDQSQITNASHLFVFCNYTQVQPNLVDEYVALSAKARAVNVEDLMGYGNFMKTKLAEKSVAEQFQWTKHQTYIALANLLAACAELKIDACPMEGFEADKYNAILGLSDRGLNASIVAPIGYRSDTDHAQHFKKIRKPLKTLFETM
ncbi:NAD(P)H-dependent oxidoreductase [Aestuariivivens insulae]|uniref:NAD(P)H-dependent oxidoreductase n=1 Tax=Aestuariivivens insulae TaxID=1621988 RepID=UPI001F5ADD30|nr:NAD(P)H-dependent oxidoreductase [Aestuariivivens insulae]